MQSKRIEPTWLYNTTIGGRGQTCEKNKLSSSQCIRKLEVVIIGCAVNAFSLLEQWSDLVYISKKQLLLVRWSFFAYAYMMAASFFVLLTGSRKAPFIHISGEIYIYCQINRRRPSGVTQIATWPYNKSTVKRLYWNRNVKFKEI